MDMGVRVMKRVVIVMLIVKVIRFDDHPHYHHFNEDGGFLSVMHLSVPISYHCNGIVKVNHFDDHLHYHRCEDGGLV